MRAPTSSAASAEASARSAALTGSDESSATAAGRAIRHRRGKAKPERRGTRFRQGGGSLRLVEAAKPRASNGLAARASSPSRRAGRAAARRPPQPRRGHRRRDWRRRPRGARRRAHARPPPRRGRVELAGQIDALLGGRERQLEVTGRECRVRERQEVPREALGVARQSPGLDGAFEQLAWFLPVLHAASDPGEATDDDRNDVGLSGRPSDRHRALGVGPASAKRSRSSSAAARLAAASSRSASSVSGRASTTQLPPPDARQPRSCTVEGACMRKRGDRCRGSGLSPSGLAALSARPAHSRIGSYSIR